VVTRSAGKKSPLPRQKSGVLGLLRWSRWKLHFFSQVLLRDYDEDNALVSVFVVFNETLAPEFSKLMARRLKTADGKLGEERTLALLALLRKKLADGPNLIEVELTATDYTREELEDFETAKGPLRLPEGAFLVFSLSRKTVLKKGKTTRTADDPDSDAGAPRYVISGLEAPPELDPYIKNDFSPDWPIWFPNPEIEGSAKLLSDCCKLLRPTWPRWAVLAVELGKAGHMLQDGVAITADNVRRLVVAAELILGNKKPDCVA